MWKLTLGYSSHLMTGKISVSRTGTIQYFWWWYMFMQITLNISFSQSRPNQKVGMNPIHSEKKEGMNWFSHLNLLWKDFHTHF
jgi:hypothetical protein